MVLRIRWRLSTILKTSKKSVRSNLFWYVRACIFWKFIQFATNWDKTQILKNFCSNNTKNGLLFFCELQPITVLLLICDSYMSWSTRFVSLKLYKGFSIFVFLSFLLKFIFLGSYFCSTKSVDSFTLKRHNSFQILNNRKATHSLAHRFLCRNRKFQNSIISAWIGTLRKLA